MSAETRRVVMRFMKAYLSLVAMVVFVLVVSVVNGSDWKVILVGMPLFLMFFVGITYQLVKEVRSLKQKNPPQ